jgi:hypothetical protein
MGFDIGGAALLTAPTSTSLSLDSGATNWMKVNANGILTRPQTPFMCGQLTGKGSIYYATPLVVTADVNIGNCWNNTTGYWTCPVAGYYMVTGGNIMGGKVSYGYFHIRKNGTSVIFTHWNHNASWHYVTLSGIIQCAAGDTISYAIVGQSPADAGAYGAGGHCMYSIALMA